MQSESLRWRRCAFVVYAATLATLMHWPRLELGPAGLPSPDRMLHMYAFAVLILLLWWTGWVRRVWAIIAIGLASVALSEMTQALPILQRHFSWQDIAAGAFGVLAAASAITAIRPVGGQRSRERRLLRARIMEATLDNPLESRHALGAWLILVGAIAGMGLGILLWWPHVAAALPNPIAGWIFGGATALFIGLLLFGFNLLWRRNARCARTRRWCPHCGRSCAGTPHDEQGVVACGHCGERTHRGVWDVAAVPAANLNRRHAARPMIVGLAILIAAFGFIYGGMGVYQWMVRSGHPTSTMQRIAREINNLPREFMMAVDLALVVMATSVVIFLYRRKLAQRFERQDAVCLQCEHDLRGTPAREGIGICGECGAAFERLTAPEPER